MPKRIDQQRATDVSRRNILLAGTTMAAASALAASAPVQTAQAQQQRPAAIPSGQRPNILVIFGDDIGQTNISAYSFGLMGYKTPNIDRVAREGMMFTDYYAEQSYSGAVVVHHRSMHATHRSLEGRYSRRDRGSASARCDAGRVAEAA